MQPLNSQRHPCGACVAGGLHERPVPKITPRHGGYEPGSVPLSEVKGDNVPRFHSAFLMEGTIEQANWTTASTRSKTKALHKEVPPDSQDASSKSTPLTHNRQERKLIPEQHSYSLLYE
ncbi:hypothetical protein MHYP_G00304340 [Metynnis hypsauchen]